MSLLTIDTNANANTDVVIDSGATVPQYSVLNFFDRGANKWAVGKTNTNTFFINETGIETPFWINPGGNIGIGALPDASNRLFVNGAIGVPATIRWKSIHGSAFIPQYLDSASFGTQGGLQIIDTFGSRNSGTIGDTGSSGPAYYFAPVELPDGCTVVDVCVDGRDAHSTQDIVVSLGRIALGTGFVTEVATTFTNGNSGTDTIQHACNGAVSETIDNANNVYFLRCRMATSGSNIHWLIAARIKYTVSSPLP